MEMVHLFYFVLFKFRIKNLYGSNSNIKFLVISDRSSNTYLQAVSVAAELNCKYHCYVSRNIKIKILSCFSLSFPLRFAYKIIEYIL